jgi:hypothetical protein
MKEELALLSKELAQLLRRCNFFLVFQKVWKGGEDRGD